MSKLQSILAAIETAAALAAKLDPAIAADVQLGMTLVGYIETLIGHAKTAPVANTATTKVLA